MKIASMYTTKSGKYHFLVEECNKINAKNCYFHFEYIVTPCVLSCICRTIPKIRSLTMESVESEKTQLEEKPGTFTHVKSL
ncbi:hypothetical protein T01_10574 [Trichinella spiralis]|uniref:Uncharacterized protein n=1 Tax=Trichinella spiralis TaxID=6334 RepID=A0A0V1BSE4_TRISP|nr:hypothetical protein T01_10574 [Trichinella spiralis]